MKQVNVYKLLFVVCMVCLMTFGVVLAQSGGVFEMHRSSVNGGGGTSAGGTFMLSGAAGQADAGKVTGGDFTIWGGFFQPASLNTIYLPAVLR
jgi:hypothetical protein